MSCDLISLSDLNGICRILERMVENKVQFIEQLVYVVPWIGIFRKRNLIFQFQQSRLDPQVSALKLYCIMTLLHHGFEYKKKSLSKK